MGRKQMNFKNGRDLMNYIVENDLLDVPVNVVFDFEKPKVEVWFGDFVFGEYVYRGNSNDNFPIVIVNSIDEKLHMYADDVDDYMTTHNYESWIIPSQYNAKIVYSETYLKDNNL
jgi:hypothetical protein